MFANFDKKKLSLSFGRGAQNYNEAAQVQAVAAAKLCEMAAPFIKKNARILDLGSGTGFISENLNTLQIAEIFEVDLTLAMLNRSSAATSKKIQADFEQLPFKNHSFDILISSFSLQWLTDFKKTFAHFFELLKAPGIFVFCLPTDGSLAELKAANIFNFNHLPEVSDIKQTLEQSGFKEFSIKSETIKQNFASGLEALKSLKKIGANYAAKNSRTITKSQLAQFNNFCLKNFSSDNKKIEISWVVSYFIFSK